MATNMSNSLANGKPCPRDITHVIFDLDGTLIDSETIETKLTSSIVERFGKTFTKELKMKMMGKNEKDNARLIVKELELPVTEEEYMSLTHELMEKEFPKSHIMPGVATVVKAFATRGVPLAIGTSSTLPLFRWKTVRHTALMSVFNPIVTSSHPEVKQAKPAPDIFLIAAEGLGVTDNSNVLVFEDSPSGVKAALAAGMRVVWAPTLKENLDPTLTGHERVEVVDSLEGFEREIGRYLTPPQPIYRSGMGVLTQAFNTLRRMIKV